jgi:hypothetical protein
LKDSGDLQTRIVGAIEFRASKHRAHENKNKSALPGAH